MQTTARVPGILSMFRTGSCLELAERGLPGPESAARPYDYLRSSWREPGP